MNRFRASDERGATAPIVAGVLAMVMFFVGQGYMKHMADAAMNKANHDPQQTYRAAESGVNVGYMHLEMDELRALPCASPVEDSIYDELFPAAFAVKITYYATPIAAGAPLACPLTAEPRLAIVSSTAHTNAPGDKARTIEATVRLQPMLDGSRHRAAFVTDQHEVD